MEDHQGTVTEKETGTRLRALPFAQAGKTHTGMKHFRLGRSAPVCRHGDAENRTASPGHSITVSPRHCLKLGQFDNLKKN